MPIDDGDIQWLLSLVETEDLAEIEVHVGDQQVLVRRRDPHPGATADATGQAPAYPGPQTPTESALPDDVTPIPSPMSGVFYRAPSPESPSYVEVGQELVEGDTVGLIEAMKLFNDVHSPVSGTVRQILVGNEQQVESGQVLMLVET